MSAIKVLMENPIDSQRLERLKMAAGPGPVLILTHDNPDPDGLSSGKALATLLWQAWGIPARMVYSGLVARAENKVMMELLTPEWEHSEAPVDLETYSALALVDPQPGAGNNWLPTFVLPHIVIDHHHPVRDGLEQVLYSDVRPDVGATASLLYQYLEAAGIELEIVLATAMFYGIQTDTRGLSRGDSPTDQGVYFKLLSRIDRKMLALVEQARLPREYYRAYCNGLEAARLYGQVIVSYLGCMHRPDFMAEMADMLIRLENTRAVLCLGHHEETMYFSVRTAPMDQDAGLLVQRVIIEPGKAGGHGTTAGGQVPLANRGPDKVVEEIILRFLDVMGETGEVSPLLRDDLNV